MKRLSIISIVVIALIMVGLIFGLSHKTMTTTVKATSSRSYAALGDSVAAGVGLTDASDASACDRTNQSYPRIIAGSQYKLTNLACSGATLNEGVLGTQTVNNLQVPSQLSQLFKQSRPNIISLTVGSVDGKT